MDLQSGIAEYNDIVMRRCTTFSYVSSPEHGLSDYLSGATNDVEQLIVQVPDTHNFYVLPVGTIPPNPAELLESPRFGKMLGELFEKRLANRDLLSLDNNLLLVETSYFDAPRNMDAMLESIFAAGYTPLLAHPERYNYMASEEDYHRLLKKGVQFQLNVLSLKGIYGPVAKNKAGTLLRANAYTRYGSYLHRPSQLQHF